MMPLIPGYYVLTSLDKIPGLAFQSNDYPIVSGPWSSAMEGMTWANQNLDVEDWWVMHSRDIELSVLGGRYGKRENSGGTNRAPFHRDKEKISA